MYCLQAPCTGPNLGDWRTRVSLNSTGEKIAVEVQHLGCASLDLCLLDFQRGDLRHKSRPLLCCETCYYIWHQCKERKRPCPSRPFHSALHHCRQQLTAIKSESTLSAAAYWLLHLCAEGCHRPLGAVARIREAVAAQLLSLS